MRKLQLRSVDLGDGRDDPPSNDSQNLVAGDHTRQATMFVNDDGCAHGVLLKGPEHVEY